MPHLPGESWCILNSLLLYQKQAQTSQQRTQCSMHQTVQLIQACEIERHGEVLYFQKDKLSAWLMGLRV